MRIFVAGATGSVGRRLVPRLVRAGHAVVGLTRTPAKAASLRDLGAEPAVADALDERTLRAAVAAARPDVIVHELTDLTGASDLRKFDRTVREQQPVANPRNGSSARRGARCWREALRRAKLLRLALRAERREREIGNGSARPQSAEGIAALARRDPLPGKRRHECDRHRWRCASLWLVLRQ